MLAACASASIRTIKAVVRACYDQQVSQPMHFAARANLGYLSDITVRPPDICRVAFMFYL